MEKISRWLVDFHCIIKSNSWYSYTLNTHSTVDLPSLLVRSMWSPFLCSYQLWFFFFFIWLPFAFPSLPINPHYSSTHRSCVLHLWLTASFQQQPPYCVHTPALTPSLWLLSMIFSCWLHSANISLYHTKEVRSEMISFIHIHCGFWSAFVFMRYDYSYTRDGSFAMHIPFKMHKIINK